MTNPFKQGRRRISIGGRAVAVHHYGKAASKDFVLPVVLNMVLLMTFCKNGRSKSFVLPGR